MNEVIFSEKEFFIPAQTDIAQRDKSYRGTILEFAIQKNIISRNAADNWRQLVRKVYTITNSKEAKEFTFTVGETNPYNGFLILSIIQSEKFYAIISFNRKEKQLDYSMVSLQDNSNILFFK